MSLGMSKEQLVATYTADCNYTIVAFLRLVHDIHALVRSEWCHFESCADCEKSEKICSSETRHNADKVSRLYARRIDYTYNPD